MLEFNENSYNSKVLAIHYANKVGGELLISFMRGTTGLRSESEALEIIEGFWLMTDLAIQDNENGIAPHDIEDIEFWMHKLFNKIGGYMAKNGFKELWQNSLNKR
jgi:hypothetical protein